MKTKILSFVLLSAIITLAQTAAPVLSKSDAKDATTPASSCRKMANGKMQSCCGKTDAAAKDEQMSCCAAKEKNATESAQIADQKVNANMCCQGEEAKGAMQCTAGGKDGKSCCNGKKMKNMKGCCASAKNEQAAMGCCGKAMDRCPMMAQSAQVDMK